MSNIKKLILEDVRCFQAETLDIRPLTFLVGENSTGKSTTLGCLQVLKGFFNNRRSGIDFNSEPYQMGAFADIVRRSSPKNDCFRLGVEFSNKHNEPFTCLLSLRERETGSEPIIDKVQYRFKNGEFTIIKGNRNADYRRLKITDHGENKFTVAYNDPGSKFNIDVSFLDYLLYTLQRKEGKKKPEEEKFLSFLGENFEKRIQLLPFRSFYNVHSFAPIRSKPKRTYDALKEIENPEGSEIPMLLRNLKNREKGRWKELHKQLVEFGKASGLFTDIVVRELGRATNDPFQLQIKVKGPKANLMDVGYGVNQILPILVRIFEARPSAMFLLQQPEVHLHPRGQAELSSLLVNMHENYSHSFLVETHSDYMIDRARILVRDGKIKSEDVSVLYFEPMKVGSAVKVHNMKMDADGNLTNVPQNYRNFFTKETDTLLGFDEE